MIRSYNYRSFLLTVFFLTLVPGVGRAQNLINDNSTQPDLWRPAMDVDTRVDAKGDLNLSIPIMSIPGRNGLDFDVKFSYRSGISAKQYSSWIGTGWSFDPGSITRDVRMMRQNGQAYNVDYDEVAAVQPDLYYVTSPSGNFTMTRHNAGTGSTTIPPPFSENNDFARIQWRPWDIEYETGYLDFGSMDHVGCICTQVISPASGGTISRDDIISWTLTDESGMRYVFAHPTLDSFRGLYSAQNLHSMEYYVSSWRLIAILGIDYTGTIPSTPDDLDHSSPGSWIKFEYSEPSAVSYNDTELTGYGAVRQAAYLVAIETPTHRAEFTSVPKMVDEEWPVVWEGGLGSIYKQLSSIRLYTLAGGQSETIVREVVLNHSGSLEGFGPTARLALDGIRTFGVGGLAASSEVPGYRFTYYGTSGGTLDDYYSDLDDFGFYNESGYNAIDTDTTDGASWNLKTVTHPVGAVEEFLYSNDEICNYCGNGVPGDYVYYIPYTEYTYFPDEIQFTTRNLSISNGRTRQGGSRLIQVNKYKTNNDSVYSTTKYLYQGGRVSGVPPAFLDRQYSSTFFKNVDRGQAAVYYNRVTRVNPDGTRAETYYTTDLSHPGVVKPVKTAVYQHDSDKLVITGNEDMLWGRPYRTVSSEGSSTESDIVEDLSIVRLSEMATIHGSEYSTFWMREGQMLTKEETRYVSGSLNAGGFISEVTEVEYDYTTGLPRTVVVHKTGLESRATELTYATDIPAYGWASSRNMLTQVAKVDNYAIDANGSNHEYYNSEVSKWALQEVPGDGSTASFPFLKTKLQWSSTTTAGIAPTFDAWDATDPAPENWNIDDTVLEVDRFGNAQSVLGASGARYDYTYTANNSRIQSTHGYDPDESGGSVLVDLFGGPSLDPAWAGENNYDAISIVDGLLVVPSAEEELGSGRPFIIRQFEESQTSPFVLEVDVRVPENASREVYISFGGSGLTNSPQSEDSALWLSFTDEFVYVFDRRKWRPGSVEIDPGQQVRVTVESDPASGVSTIRINGQRAYQTLSYITSVSAVEKISLGVQNTVSQGGQWTFDNLRIYPAADIVGTFEYDALFLRPTTTIDEQGVLSRYTYDSHGRMSNEYTSAGQRKKSTAYRMSRSDNTDDYQLESPNQIESRLYAKNAAPELWTSEGWLSTGLVEFGKIGNGKPAVHLGGNPELWSWIRFSDIDGPTTAEVDFFLDDNLTGVPHIVSFIGTGQTFAVRYNGSTGLLCISYSNATYQWTWSCWSNYSVVPDTWYTATITSREGGYMDAHVSRANDPSNSSSLKSVGGYDLTKINFVRSMAKEDWLQIADYYVGDVTRKVEFIDALGRPEQELVVGNSSGFSVGYTYDHMDRVTREYLPVPAMEYINDIADAAQSHYTAKYPGQTVWPYKESVYDGLGRQTRMYPSQSGSVRISEDYAYHGEIFTTTLSSSDDMMDVVTTTTVDGNRVSVVTDGLERTRLKRVPVRRSITGTFPANQMLAVSRQSSSFQADHSGDGEIPPTDIDFNDWVYDEVTVQPAQSFLAEFDIQIDVAGSGDAFVVMKKNGSTEWLWVFDNTQSPTTYSGVVPLYEGQQYEFEVGAGISDDEQYPGSTSAELSLTFSHEGTYLAFNETEFRYDHNDNVVEELSPECFANPDLCTDGAATWRVLSHYDTASQLTARSTVAADGDGDGDPTNELVGVDADFRHKYLASGLSRVTEDPNLRNATPDGFHIRSYDVFGRTSSYGIFDGKYSFDFFEPGQWQNLSFDETGSQTYSGGRLREAVYDSTKYVYGYDDMGNVTEISVDIPGLEEKVVRYKYDRLGNPVQTSYAAAPWLVPQDDDAFFVWYEYDGLGRLARVKSNSSDDVELATVDVIYTYKVSGQPAEIALGENTGQSIQYEYDIAGRLTSINDVNSEASGVFAQMIGYDIPAEIALSSEQTIGFSPRHDGNASWTVWRTDGNIDGGAVAGYMFSYDELNRLTEADFGKRYSLNSSWSFSSRYDLNARPEDGNVQYDMEGNLLSLRRYSETGGATTATYNYDVQGSSLLTGVTGGIDRAFEYDYNGNVHSDGADLMDVEYDERNMPIRILTESAATDYKYDTHGLRVRKEGGNDAYYIRGKDGQVLATYGSDGLLNKWNIVASGSIIGYAIP